MNSNTALDSPSLARPSGSRSTPRSPVPSVPEPVVSRAPGRRRKRLAQQGDSTLSTPALTPALTKPPRDKTRVLRVTRTTSSDSEIACLRTNPEFSRGYEEGAHQALSGANFPLFLEEYATARRPRYEEGYRLGVSAARMSVTLGPKAAPLPEESRG